MRVERSDVRPLPQPARRPVDEARHPVAAIIDITLLAAHAGVKEFHSHGSAVVGQKNQNRVALQSRLGKSGPQPADLGVNLLDGREEKRGSGINLLRVSIRRRGIRKGYRVMRRIGAQVNEERFRSLLAVADEINRGVEEDFLRPTVVLLVAFPLWMKRSLTRSLRK